MAQTVTRSPGAISGGTVPVDDSLEPAGDLTIDQAARLLGVPAPTIRSWERRYGVPSAGRSQGGHRRYSADQLDLVRRMRDLVAQGRRTVDAAAQVRAERDTSAEPLVEELLTAASALQPAAIAEVLDRSHQVLGLDRTIDEILLPALRTIGQRWADGLGEIGHEHLATAVTQAWLSGVAGTSSVPGQQHPIVLAGGPLDHHTLGLEALGALLRHRGWDCLMLGARTPGETLHRAAVETSADGVVLVCHLGVGRRAAVEALRTTAELDTRLFYAGGAFATPQSRRGVPGVYLGNRLAVAADLIATTLLGDDPTAL